VSAISQRRNRMPTGPIIGNGRHDKIQRFDYPADPDSEAVSCEYDWLEDTTSSNQQSGQQIPLHAESDLQVQFEQRLGEETRRSYEAGREKGRLEGRRAGEEAHAASGVAEREQHIRQRASLIDNFAQERDRYLNAAEREVVMLALAVSARILRREAQMDPLLLTGAVRVALGQLSTSTHVQLRVPQSDLAMWIESIAILPNLPVKPEVLVGEEMRLGDCTIKTELGTVDLGIRAQLAEIERGFFDRAGSSSARPAAHSDAGAERERRP